MSQQANLETAKAAAQAAITIAADCNKKPRNQIAGQYIRNAKGAMTQATCVGDYLNVIERCIRSVQTSQGTFTVHQSRLLALRTIAKN